MEIEKMNAEDIEKRMSEIKEEMSKEDADIDALSKEVDKLEERRNVLKETAEKRAKLNARVAGGAGTVIEHAAKAKAEVNADEKRAAEFVQSNHVSIETRTLLSSGKIVKPSKAQSQINGLADYADGIVDDVHAVALTGVGSYTVPLKKARAKAADITEGSAPASTAAEYDYVTINPAEWGTLDEVSMMVAKLSPVDYMADVEASAVEALRETASAKIIAAILASKNVQTVKGVALDQNFIRTIVLGFRAISGKGNTKLYLAQADLATLGKVRGTNEKKAVFEITFDAGTTLSGTIQDGGLSVPFRVCDDLTAGTQLYGQPGTVDMPMWGNYEVTTNQGGKYFDAGTIGIKGTQTAGADVTAVNGMQIIKQAAE